jgi:predicted GTPase
MPGLRERTETAADLLRQAARADLIVWVAAATQPARGLDKSGLDALRSWARAQLERRPPPILLALTHVDQLSPAGEWLPPYDITTPSVPKARAIRAAIDAVSRTLDLPADVVVPVAMPPGRGPYNLDALWARIALALDEAKLVQLDRLRVDQRAFGMGELADQLANTGRLIIKGITKT